MTVLAVGAHPDDLELLCAGTLAKYVRRGDRVEMAVLARGDLGSATRSREEIAAIREGEARRAAALLGAELHWLGCDDLEIAFEPELRLRLMKLIRELRPEVILSHSGEDYMLDHQQAALLTEEASFGATVPHYRMARPRAAAGGLAAEEPAGVFPLPALYHFDTVGGLEFQPTEYVDISGTFELKRRMLACHESQVEWIADHEQTDLMEMMEVQSRFRGQQCGARYAEGFRPLLRWGRVRPARLLP